MDSPAAIVALVLVAIFLVGGGAVSQLAFEEAGTHYSFTEKFDAPQVGQTVTFNESNQAGVYYDSQVSVTLNNSTEMIAQQDYTWDEKNGTLTVQSDTLANQTNVSISYGYDQPTAQQTEVAGYVATLFDSGMWIPLLLLIALLLAVLGIFGGLA